MWSNNHRLGSYVVMLSIMPLQVTYIPILSTAMRVTAAHLLSSHKSRKLMTLSVILPAQRTVIGQKIEIGVGRCDNNVKDPERKRRNWLDEGQSLDIYDEIPCFK